MLEGSDLIRLPENVGRVVSKAYKVEQRLAVSLGRDPEPGEVAQAMGIAEQTLQEALACEQQRQSMKSLQGLLREEDAEDRQSFSSLFEAWVEADEARRVRVELAVQEALLGLSPREREVMRWVSEGLTNKEVAGRLGLSEGTIKIHLHNIYEKVGVPNRTALTALAIAYRNQIAV